MSWILSVLKNENKLVALVLAFFGILLFVFKLYILSVVVFLLLLTHILVFKLNKVVIKKLNKQAEVFTSLSEIRNVDYLVIGDMCQLDLLGNKVELLAPGRGINACYEILRHTHSILKPGGKVIVAVKKKSVNNSINSFDLPFFHSITINRLQLKNIKQKRIAYLHLIRSIKYILNVKSKGYVFSKCYDERIITFCEERGYNFEFLLKS